MNSISFLLSSLFIGKRLFIFENDLHKLEEAKIKFTVFGALFSVLIQFVQREFKGIQLESGEYKNTEDFEKSSCSASEVQIFRKNEFR